MFQRISEGDEEAFGILFNSSLQTLEPFIRKLVKKQEDVKEVIQATFMRVWLSRDKLAAIEQPRAWLTRVAANECYTLLRKEATEFRLRQAAQESVMPDTDTGQFSFRELQHIIEEAVMQLSPQRRRIFQMSRNQGMKIPEIAEALDLSPHTVKNALVASLKFIREYLQRYGHTFPLIFLMMICR
ncbi:RNA polymerase sigma factor [Chitinophaga solisilvae]|uniref:Sigma-70 family RNA polymerase sigma factor n=1 Tax=Chitinophaga solisilvae TaxID=1233460 RepID=A0A9Q5D8S6_9BACT|nr:sigma-70 family RNA polymerase sigma factor [Chitinophaga solisilvae]NSL87266.1 sigma-70 family RNA polymerase sigma factor [Chitinophaga solisilvae]